MKKVIYAIIATLILVSILPISAVAYTSEVNKYAKLTVVVEVDPVADKVHAVDFNGNEWIFTKCEDWQIGDYCVMLMSDNATENNIYDDEILSCQYGGYLMGAFGKTENSLPVIES